MKFTTARLCGGKALMAVSADVMDIDMDKAEAYVKGLGCRVSSKDDMMMIFDWNGMEVTWYS